MTKRPSFRRPLIALVTLTLVGVVATTAERRSVQASDWKPAAPPTIYDPTAGPNAVRRRDFIVDVCTTAAQLDCLESIGAYLNGAWVEGTFNGTYGNGLDGTPASTNWTIPGVTGLNGSSVLRVNHLVNYTGNLLLHTSIAPSGANGDREENSLPRDTKFRASIRTSWVLPTHVSGKMSESKIKVEKLSVSGASRVTMEGIPITYMVVLDQSTLTSPTGRGEYEVRDFNMTVSDGRFYPIKKDCIEKPTAMTSENGYGHPLPTFTNGNLDLKVSAPHFRSNGTTQHIGIYEASIPIEMATCLWGSSITAASKFEVQVIETNGTTKTATTSISVNDEAVLIRATGFTFSTPTIRVSYTAPATPTTAAAGGAKPAKPTGVKAVGTKGGGMITFNRVSGVTYSVVATKGKVRRNLRCTSSAGKASCKAGGLGSGSWKITVTPRSGSTAGDSLTTTLRVK